ncbi:hypothetical protein [Rhizobium sp. 1399]|uniref:hypothetical protein n=1 Tax=Rhizobium sp. 1399 TaxID=2817758 RepID=UPI00285AD992|nr:hypothetical protein [Rhizobium sp. 1399]MDR6670210.1 hypothetical protein [Rhizobium sp. 1399]
MKSWLAIFLPAGLAACASLPETTKVTAFGTAVDAGVTVVRQVGVENASIALLYDKEAQAGRYMCGDEWEAVTKPKSSIKPEEIAFRIKRLEALAAYASALKTATDQSGVDKLADAANNLIVTATSLVAASAPAAAPLVAPIGKIVGKGVGLAIQDRYARQVNSIIAVTDPSLQKLVSQLVTDMSKVERASQKTLNDYKIARDVNLENMRIQQIVVSKGTDTPPDTFRCIDGEKFDPTGPNVKVILNETEDRGAVHDRLIAGIDEEIAAQAAIEAANRSGPVLKKIAVTHHALAQQSPDTNADIRELLSLTDALADLVSAAKKEK